MGVGHLGPGSREEGESLCSPCRLRFGGSAPRSALFQGWTVPHFFEDEGVSVRRAEPPPHIPLMANSPLRPRDPTAWDEPARAMNGGEDTVGLWLPICGKPFNGA